MKHTLPVKTATTQEEKEEQKTKNTYTYLALGCGLFRCGRQLFDLLEIVSEPLESILQPSNIRSRVAATGLACDRIQLVRAETRRRSRHISKEICCRKGSSSKNKYSRQCTHLLGADSVDSDGQLRAARNNLETTDVATPHWHVLFRNSFFFSPTTHEDTRSTVERHIGGLLFHHRAANDTYLGHISF